MIRNWWSFWLGFVRIRVEGTQLEKFINMAAGRGVPLYDLRKESHGGMTAKVRLDGFRSLRHVARKTRSRVRIEERSGFPFVLATAKRRQSLYLGAVAFVLVIYALSTIIWDVDVVGNERVDKQRILEAANQYGIRVGNWKPLADVREAERAIINSVRDLEWVGIHHKGTRMIIEVQEKVLPNPPSVMGPTNLVAAKDGVIQRILVLVGEGKVQEGANVTKGQLLISGVLYAPNTQGGPTSTGDKPPEPPAILEKVQAKGEVWARVWYGSAVEEPVNQEGAVPTGQVERQWRIKWGNQEIIIKGPRISPFSTSVEEVYTRTPLLWRNLQIPVEIIETEYHELRAYRHERTPQEAIIAAREKARQAVNAGLAPGARVLREMVVPQPAPPGMVKVKVAVEVLEDIATPQPAEPAVWKQMRRR